MDQHAIRIVRIRDGKEKQLVRHHPWVFSGAVEKTSGADSQVAGVVRVEDASGHFIAYGWEDPKSHILIRLLSWNEQVFPDESWWVGTISASIRRRLGLFSDLKRTNAWRLVHGEADFLPGLAIDMYDSTIMCLVSARVAWDLRHLVVRTLQRLLNPSRIILLTDPAFCGIEQMKEVVEWYARGKLVEPAEDVSVEFRENGLTFSVFPGEGQKSGFFCDQRENRTRVASYASGRRCLDAFCYTGGFSLNLLAAGATSVTAVDSSAPALEGLARHARLNVGKQRIPSDSIERLTVEQADVFTYLRNIEEGSFDCIVLDPPKLAQTKAQVAGALRAYKDLNRLAIKNISRGGIIASFSCSSNVSREQLRTVIAWAAKDAGKEVQVLETLGQGPDHPVRLSFPESEYLKGFIYLVI